jgi:hypothetical protein
MTAGSVNTTWKYNRQQVGLALGEPLLGSGALTLRTMPVAATIVGDDRVGAVLAARDMAAERRGAAVLDRRHDLHLAETDVSGVGAPPRRPVVAEDIRDLQRRTRHDRRYAGGWSLLFFLGLLRGCDSRSSGLSMPAIMPVATRV